MHTLSSASRTCMASASAVECTATVAMPSSLHARWMRSAISPRLAIRTLSNILVFRHSALGMRHQGDRPDGRLPMVDCRSPLFDDHERFAELDRLAVLDQDGRYGSGARSGDLVHGLHRFDDE